MDVFIFQDQLAFLRSCFSLLPAAVPVLRTHQPRPEMMVEYDPVPVESKTLTAWRMACLATPWTAPMAVADTNVPCPLSSQYCDPVVLRQSKAKGCRPAEVGASMLQGRHWSPRGCIKTPQTSRRELSRRRLGL